MSNTSVNPALGALRRSAIIKYVLMICAITAGSLLVWPGLLRNLTSSNFMPIGMCMLWQPKLLWLHITSDGLIGLSYIVISATLAWLVYRAKNAIPFSWVFVAFGLFIVACGATHLVEILTLWHPYYWISGEVKLITAIASVTTAIALPPLVPRILHSVQDARMSALHKEEIRSHSRQIEELTQRLGRTDANTFMSLPKGKEDEDSEVERWIMEAETRRGELRHALDELRSSEAKFRAALDAMPQIVWTADASGSVDWYNKRWCDYTGLSVDQSKDWGWQPVIHPDDLQACMERWTHAVASGERYEIEYRYRRHDGVYRWYLGRAEPWRDEQGKIVKWFGVSTDIDDQKRTEIAMQQLALIVESSDDAIYTKTLDGIVTSWNRGAEKMYGYTAAEIVGKPIWLLSPPNRMFEETNIMDRLRRGERIQHMQTSRQKKNGEIIDVALSISVMRDAAGRISGASTIARDVTEVKRVEQALHNSEKHAMVGRLAAVMAHEINNPLEAVANVLYLLGMRPELDDDARRYAEIATQEVSRIAHIVKQTLGFYRSSSSPVSVKITDIVDDVLVLYARKLETMKIRVEKKYDSRSEISGLPSEIRQVFSNLIVNAIEASRREGTLKIHAFSSCDWRNPERRGVRVVISDTGTGIARENRRALFEPFFSTKGEKGTGLGLWVSNGIVQKHGGSIRVRSSTGPKRTGTCFMVFLPAAPVVEISRTPEVLEKRAA